MKGSEEPAFIVDAMLGKLARWLRILGYDTIYVKSSDEVLIRRALEDGRTILTSDLELFRSALKNGAEAVLIKGSRPADMLAEVANYIERSRRISPEEFLRPKSVRCTSCNGPLYYLDGRYKCCDCGKPYWKGSHWKGIELTIGTARRLAKGGSMGSGLTR